MYNITCGDKNLKISEEKMLKYEYLKNLFSFREKNENYNKETEVEEELFNFISQDYDFFSTINDNIISDFLGFDNYIQKYPLKYQEIFKRYLENIDELIQITSDTILEIDDIDEYRNIKGKFIQTYSNNSYKFVEYICEKLIKWSDYIVIAGGCAGGFLGGSSFLAPFSI